MFACLRVGRVLEKSREHVFSGNVKYPNHPGTHGDHSVTTEWIDIEFTGHQTSTSRAQPLNGSHIYVALASVISEVLLGDINMDGTVNFLDISPFIDILTRI